MRAEITDHGHRLLLRARRERPRGCRAVEQRDELAPLARLAQNEELGCTDSDTGGRGRLGPMMSSINDVAKLYDEFEEAFVDVMTAKSEELSFSRRMKLRLARSRLRAHKDFTQREYEAAVLRADARSWKILG